MRKGYIFIILSIFFIFVGCTKERVEESRLEPMSLEKLSDNLIGFVDRRIKENGVFKLNTSDGSEYLFLNGSNVIQGERASYYDNIWIEDDGNTAKIYFNEFYIDNYQGEELENIKLYKMVLKDTTEYIGIYKNDQETYFDSIDITK